MNKFGYSKVTLSSFELIRKIPQLKVNVAFRKNLNDIYLRFGKYDLIDMKSKKTIVIARLGFNKKKKGFGTALLKALCIFGEKFGYTHLEVERPNADCQIFMKKLGFKDEFYLPIESVKKFYSGI